MSSETKKQDNAKNTEAVSKQRKRKKFEFPELGTKYIAATGKRKNAIAQVRLFSNGQGKIIINGKDLKEIFPQDLLRQNILEPLVLTGLRDSVNLSVIVSGGGLSGQSIAIRHGIARALVLMDLSYRKVLKQMGFLTRDPRVKERKKPGLKKARRAPQWSKR